MGKLIAVYGAPGAGCTTFALKLAQYISLSNDGKPVIFLSPDIRIPALSVIFPHRTADDLYSLGDALDRTDIRPENITDRLVTVRAMPNLGYLGYKGGENCYSYPRLTEDKVIALLICLKNMADTVIVDCTNNPDDLITIRAIAVCDHAIRLVTPDLKCMSYFASRVEAEPSMTKRITVVNQTDRSVFLPLTETKEYFGAGYILPFSLELRQQSVVGRLSDKATSKKYCKILNEIAKEVS